MAYYDYAHCDLCDAKAFYDADVDWGVENVGDMKVRRTQELIDRLGGRFEGDEDA